MGYSGSIEIQINRTNILPRGENSIVCVRYLFSKFFRSDEEMGGGAKVKRSEGCSNGDRWEQNRSLRRWVGKLHKSQIICKQKQRDFETGKRKGGQKHQSKKCDKIRICSRAWRWRQWETQRKVVRVRSWRSRKRHRIKKASVVDFFLYELCWFCSNY